MLRKPRDGQEHQPRNNPGPGAGLCPSLAIAPADQKHRHHKQSRHIRQRAGSHQSASADKRNSGAGAPAPYRDRTKWPSLLLPAATRMSRSARELCFRRLPGDTGTTGRSAPPPPPVRRTECSATRLQAAAAHAATRPGPEALTAWSHGGLAQKRTEKSKQRKAVEEPRGWMEDGGWKRALLIFVPPSSTPQFAAISERRKNSKLSR